MKYEYDPLAEHPTIEEEITQKILDHAGMISRNQYECTSTTTYDGKLFPRCGAAEIHDGKAFCTHPFGLICPEYSNQRCGFAKKISNDLDQIEMTFE